MPEIREYLAETFFEYEIGQFNYFFRVNLDHEPLLHNLTFAASTICFSSKHFDEYTIEGDERPFFTPYNLHNCDLEKK